MPRRDLTSFNGMDLRINQNPCNCSDYDIEIIAKYPRIDHSMVAFSGLDFSFGRGSAWRRGCYKKR